MANQARVDHAISTIVFLDFEATDFLGYGRRPKITELCLLAVHRDELLTDHSSCLPRILNKLTMCLNPKIPIHPESSAKTG